MTNARIDLERDRNLYGDLNLLENLKLIQDPTEDFLRLHAGIVRRLLTEGELAAAAGRRRLPLAFYPPDSLPLVRAARNARSVAFCMFGIEVFGIQWSAAFVNTGNLTLMEGFNPDSQVSLKLDSLLKQVVAMSPALHQQHPKINREPIIKSEFITRHDIINYISNKIGGVHYDPKPNEKSVMTKEKMSALGRLRRAIKIEITNEIPTISFNIKETEEDKNSKFRYTPNSLDAIYLEFIAIIELIISSADVKSLKNAIAIDIGAP